MILCKLEYGIILKIKHVLALENERIYGVHQSCCDIFKDNVQTYYLIDQYWSDTRLNTRPTIEELELWTGIDLYRGENMKDNFIT
uniref:Uncharacterized protein n=1 Tax=viral metagenome TaxID=1070528 RepID=A0A6C0J6M3_9ZZZZ